MALDFPGTRECIHILPHLLLCLAKLWPNNIQLPRKLTQNNVHPHNPVQFALLSFPELTLASHEHQAITRTGHCAVAAAQPLSSLPSTAAHIPSHVQHAVSRRVLSTEAKSRSRRPRGCDRCGTGASLQHVFRGEIGRGSAAPALGPFTGGSGAPGDARG